MHKYPVQRVLKEQFNWNHIFQIWKYMYARFLTYLIIWNHRKSSKSVQKSLQKHLKTNFRFQKINVAYMTSVTQKSTCSR